MVKYLVHWALAPEVWVPDLAGSMCCVLEQDTLLSHNASLQPGVKVGTGK